MNVDGLHNLHLLSEFAMGSGALLRDVIQTNVLVFFNSVDFHTHTVITFATLVRSCSAMCT